MTDRVMIRWRESPFYVEAFRVPDPGVMSPDAFDKAVQEMNSFLDFHRFEWDGEDDTGIVVHDKAKGRVEVSAGHWIVVTNGGETGYPGKNLEITFDLNLNVETK